MPDSADTRRKTIGLLIRRARETAGRSGKDCAAFAGISHFLMAKYEEGLREPSLVELEALAHYLRIPVQALLDEAVSDRVVAPHMNFNIVEVTRLRKHIIGTRLKQARLKTNQSVRQLAAAAGMTTAKLNAYELGKRPIPITELEQLLARLDLPLEALLDIGIGPLGQAQLRYQQHTQYDCLPDDVRAFVADPDALPYLRLAMRLRKLPQDELQHAGNALIELSQTPNTDAEK